MIAGCSDSAIPEVEFEVPDEERIERIPTNPNPEPPELVAEYHALWDEIQREQLDGEVDSTKVLEAYRLAVELAKYDGPMAFIFKINEAKAQGRSKEELQVIIEEYYGLTRLAQANNPCLILCVQDLGVEIGRAYEDHENGAEDCVAAGFLTGGMTGFFGGGPAGGVVGLIAGGVACAWSNDRDLHQALERAAEDFQICRQRCPPE